MRKVLIACYGGGHVQSLIPVAQRLAARGDVALTVLGFTTARAAFQRAGLPALGYDLLLRDEDGEWLEFARDHTPRSRHADVTQAETDAYFALGLRDLALEHGKDRALAMFAEKDRKAFVPQAMFRRYLAELAPDLIVTSTSPRSELALLQAGRDMGIETLAVADLFLQAESAYICTPDYALNITVMADYVRRFLTRKGYGGKIYVTGNPAFDPLAAPDMNARRARGRQALALAPDSRLVMWVCPSARVSMIGRAFADPDAVLAMLETLCTENPDLSYLVRQHPNNPILTPGSTGSSLLPPADWSIEDCLAVCDVVLLETSTVGMQAALLGKPVVTVNAGDYPPYAELGLASNVDSIEKAAAALLETNAPDLTYLGYPDLGRAAKEIENLIVSKLLSKM